jgi:hypothetical protein
VNRRGWIVVVLAAAVTFGPAGMTGVSIAALPDSRGYEMVSPVLKNGVSLYAAVPSLNGELVNFQARGGLASSIWGSLNAYQATRTAGGWQTTPLEPHLLSPLGFLEEQVPVWFSADLMRSVFTTPISYASDDENQGALDLYGQGGGNGWTLLSQGTQGGFEPNEVTFDAATADGMNVVFSTETSLLPAATGLNVDVFPAPEFLYKRDTSDGETSLESRDSAGRLAGYAESTVAADYSPGVGLIRVARTEGFFPGQLITVGTGASTETAQITHVEHIEAATEELNVNNGTGLVNAHVVGEPVRHLSEGAILGDGGHLTVGLPPAAEYVSADTNSGSTTNAVSSDGSKVFFESPSPDRGQPVGLYMRRNDTTTVQIAGARPYGTTVAGLLAATAEPLFGSARFEGAAADGALAIFTSEEGLAGAAAEKEVYEFNSTGREIGGLAPLSVSPISDGLGGDHEPSTTLTSPVRLGDGSISVSSTAGFVAGETIAIGPFEFSGVGPESPKPTFVRTITAVKNGNELIFTPNMENAGFAGIAAGTLVHGLHPASVVAVANDGLHVFFESNGVLATNVNAYSVSAVAMRPNLYVFDTGTGLTTFVAELAEKDVTQEGDSTGLVGEPDISRPAVSSPDGGVLVLLSAGNLTGQNPWEEYREVYRYAVSGKTLICLSCTAAGVRPIGDASFGETAGGTYDPPGLTSPMSEDGSRVFFDSPDSLVPADTNGEAPLSAKFGTPTSTDVYEWSASSGVGLISSGKSSNPSTLQGTTPSGDDVLFTTTAQLVPQGADGGFENVYDARVGGGFPAASGGGAPSCVGETCRSAFGVAPAEVMPGSVSPQSAGAPSAVKPKPKPPACRKGFVRKRVKRKLVCVRKKPSKASRAGKGAGRVVRGAGAGRSGRVVGVGVHRSR